MSQSETNKQWEKTTMKIGDGLPQVTSLVQPRHVTPGLRKPYEWSISGELIDALVLALRGIANSRKRLLQCALVESKRLAFGRRVSIFLLGYRPGFCGESSSVSGITEDQWKLASDAVRLALQVLPDAKPYIEDWSDSRKFQLRFEAYIHESK